MAIAENENENVVKVSLDDWYNAKVKDYETFLSKHSNNYDLADQGSKLDDMKEWCNRNEISFTPTFFINGHQLPAQYKINDLNYLLS